MSKDGLVFVGKVIDMQPIPGADFIISATVVCGEGGKWKGVVKKCDFTCGDTCLMYLPDALIPESEEMLFMKNSGWRVKMKRLRGVPSEVLIMPNKFDLPVGTDCTLSCGVTRYLKPIPPHLQGISLGNFPSFIPKTDEPNYQRHEKLVQALCGKPYYITEKADGSSTTAFKYKGKFGLCSRNLELERNEDNGYWKVALRYDLENKLPDNHAIQWETCGPGIQSNPMGLGEISGFGFSAYNISQHRYLDMGELFSLFDSIHFPHVKVIDKGNIFDRKGLELLGEGLYGNGKQREGVVVRSSYNIGGAPISFKVINLNYEK